MFTSSKTLGEAPGSDPIGQAVELYRDAIRRGKTPLRWEVNHSAHRGMLPHMFDRTVEVAAVFSLPIRVDDELGVAAPVVYLMCREG